MGIYFDAIVGAVEDDWLLSEVWRKNVESGRIEYDFVNDNDARTEAVGLQAKWDEALSTICNVLPTLYTVLTPTPSNPFVLNRDNIDEFVEEGKQETVLARIGTAEQVLKQGHPVIIGASSKGWEDIKGTSKEMVWNDLSEKYPNLYAVGIDLPEGLSGALTICKDEMTSINFTQAHETKASIAGKYIIAGNLNNAFNNRLIEKRVTDVLTPLMEAEGEHQNIIAPFLERVI